MCELIRKGRTSLIDLIVHNNPEKQTDCLISRVTKWLPQLKSRQTLSAVFVLMALEHETHPPRRLHAEAVKRLGVRLGWSEREEGNEWGEDNDYAWCMCCWTLMNLRLLTQWIKWLSVSVSCTCSSHLVLYISFALRVSLSEYRISLVWKCWWPDEVPADADSIRALKHTQRDSPAHEEVLR